MKARNQEDKVFNLRFLISINFTKDEIVFEIDEEVYVLKDVKIDDYGYNFITDKDLCFSREQHFWNSLGEMYLTLLNKRFCDEWRSGEVKIGWTVNKEETK